jgi:hypothetical protein
MLINRSHQPPVRLQHDLSRRAVATAGQSTSTLCAAEASINYHLGQLRAERCLADLYGAHVSVWTSALAKTFTTFIPVSENIHPH